jgi:hypothetical protein
VGRAAFTNLTPPIGGGIVPCEVGIDGIRGYRIEKALLAVQ